MGAFDNLRGDQISHGRESVPPSPRLEMQLTARLGRTYWYDRLVRDELLAQPLHCRICQFPYQPPFCRIGVVWALYDTGQRDSIEVWAVLFGFESDWSGELWVPHDFEVGVAVDG
jgi:hypothetical protein